MDWVGLLKDPSLLETISLSFPPHKSPGAPYTLLHVKGAPPMIFFPLVTICVPNPALSRHALVNTSKTEAFP